MLRLPVSLLCLALVLGCASWQKRREMESVARDWCYTIRASQILPVYPLNEDVQPGDLYLVQVPIDRQQEIYRESGFLPLDNMIGRQDPTRYEAFYDTSFELGGATPLPKHFLAESGARWADAPTAAFPSYAFSVRTGSGAKVAIPVSGVPVGLSLMNSEAAEGSITIADVRTYGVDAVSLFGDVRAWAEESENRRFLQHFGPRQTSRWLFFEQTRYNYLRVVSRVFAAREVNVSLHDSSGRAAQVDAGVPRTIELVHAETGVDAREASVANYEKNVESLNSALEHVLQKTDAAGEVLPGGSLKVVAASSRSISLVETFPKPLVIGYLGFDMAILADGILGPPIPTYAVLAQGLEPPPQSTGTFTPREAEMAGLLDALDTSGRPEIHALAAEALGPPIQRRFDELEPRGEPPRNRLRRAIADYTRPRGTRQDRMDHVIDGLRTVVRSN